MENVTPSNGIIQRLKELRQDEQKFLRVQGIEEAIAKNRVEITQIESAISGKKQELADMKAEKAKAVSLICAELEKQMQAVLATGKPVFQIEEGNVFIGYQAGDRITPYAGLSGGEKVEFDAAVAGALSKGNGTILIIEAAEMDDDRLGKTLTHIKEKTPENIQVIVNTCHAPEQVPDGWQVTEIFSE